MKKEGFTILQAMALLLLKPLDLPANYTLNLIIWITNPKNKINLKWIIKLYPFYNKYPPKYLLGIIFY